MTPRLRACGDADCRICRWRDTNPPDSGHPEDEPLASALVGVAAIVLLFVVAFVLLPVLLPAVTP